MNQEELKDIRGPVALPGDLWWLWIILALIAAGLLWWGIRSFKRSIRQELPLAPVVPPWDKALAELSRLEQRKRESFDGIRQFYFLLSLITRVYIEERFNIRAPEMTTEEFIDSARRSPDLSAEHQMLLQELLNASDMVKFARFNPLAAEMADVLRLARRFVEDTRPSAIEAVQ